MESISHLESVRAGNTNRHPAARNLSENIPRHPKESSKLLKNQGPLYFHVPRRAISVMRNGTQPSMPAEREVVDLLNKGRL